METLKCERKDVMTMNKDCPSKPSGRIRSAIPIKPGSNKTNCNTSNTRNGKKDDPKTEAKNRTIAFTMMAVNLFFWYFATTQINDWIYYAYQFTVVSTVYNTLLYTVSSLVYAYLIYEIVKIEKFSLTNSFIILGFMVFLSLMTLVIFPLPLI